MENLVKHRSETPIEMHRHGEARLILFLEGDVRETDIFGSRRYIAGNVLFRPPFCLHGNPANENEAAYIRLAVPKPALHALVAKYHWRPLLIALNFEKREDRAMLKGQDIQELTNRFLVSDSRLRVERPDENESMQGRAHFENC